MTLRKFSSRWSLELLKIASNHLSFTLSIPDLATAKTKNRLR